MILVLLGTQDKEFTRLLKQIDEAVHKKIIKDKVLVQAGHTKYESNNMEIFDFKPISEIQKLINECDILITHGGVASIIDGLKAGKIVIAAPRLKKYKEHTNDHQLQIINQFSNEGYILSLNENKSLTDIFLKAKAFKPKKFVTDNSKMLNIISNFIDNN